VGDIGADDLRKRKPGVKQDEKCDADELEEKNHIPGTL